MRFNQLLYFNALIVSAIISGCCNVGCEEDRAIGECMIKLIPYNPNDYAQFVSQSNDTLTFRCNLRDTYFHKEAPSSRDQQECCESIDVENFSCKFDKNPNSSFQIGNDNFGQQHISCSVGIDTLSVGGVWYFFNCHIWQYGEALDSIKLAGKVFHQVFTPETGDSTIYLEPKSLGIVGFKLAGKEWRKL